MGRIIAISGLHGAGMSATVKNLRRIIGEHGKNIKHMRAGDVWRKLHEEAGLNLGFSEYYKATTVNANLVRDREMYDLLKKSEGNYIMEGLFSAIACDEYDVVAHTVFLNAPTWLRAERKMGPVQQDIFKDAREKDLISMANTLIEKETTERGMCFAMYRKDFTYPGHYDQVIDTSHYAPDVVAKMILERNKWLKSADITTFSIREK